MSEMKKRKVDKREQKVQKELSSLGESLNTSSGGDAGVHKSYKLMLFHRGYVVRETLGEGSYSKVKRAECVDEGQRSVAIKIIDKNRAPRDYQDRFLPREIKIWPLLNHPHLLNLHAFFSDSRRVYMVVDYAENGDVLKYIQAQGSVSESVARKWMMQVLDAVRYMHFHDITHRDLKLENLLLDGMLNIKIGDFGFVKENSSMSLSQTYCGSKSYAAPEILMGRPYDPKKADVWALGVILYIIITGKMPFDESRGTRSILKEQQVLRLYWPKSKYISEDCKNFIHLLFTYDFMTRPTVGDLFANRWFLLSTETVSYNANENNNLNEDPLEMEYISPRDE